MEIYNTHCESLEGPLADHIGTTYGVVRNAALNGLSYFHTSNIYMLEGKYLLYVRKMSFCEMYIHV